MEMKRGDLAIFAGRFLHKSDDNVSNKSRYAYTWHCFESDSKWSKANWIQKNFTKLYRK